MKQILRVGELALVSKDASALQIALLRVNAADDERFVMHPVGPMG
jgi:hypothetical protein